jgi:ferredoxin
LLGFLLLFSTVSVTIGTMQLVIDADRCQGHNRCYAIVPELVDVDDLGNAFVLGDGLVPEELIAKAELAVKNCPERAIALVSTSAEVA